MERHTANYGEFLEERTRHLSDSEVCALLRGPVNAQLLDWTNERLAPVQNQIRRSADVPYLSIMISLAHYPPLGEPIEFSGGFPIEVMKTHSPVYESFDEIVAAWQLESDLRSLLDTTPPSSK